MMMGAGRGTSYPMRLRLDDSITKQKVKPGTVRRILPYAKPYRWMLALLLFVTALDAAITVANPVLLGLVIDRGILPRRLGILITVAVLIAILAVVDTVANYLQAWSSARIGQGLILDLRSKVFANVLQQPLAFFTRSQTGSLVQPAQYRRDRSSAGHYHPAVPVVVNHSDTLSCAGCFVRSFLADQHLGVDCDSAFRGAGKDRGPKAAAACTSTDAAGRRARVNDE